MKKFFVLFLCFVLIFVSGCKQEDLINTSIFISRFNRLSDETIDKKSICAIERNDTLIYNFVLEETYLLTIECENDSKKIKRCCLAASKDKNLNEETFFSYCKYIIMSFEKSDESYALNILNDFSFKKGHFTKNYEFYFYCLSLNSVGVFFTVDSTRLITPETTNSKLNE